MKIASASSPIHDLSMLAAECTTPRRTMPGTVTPTGRVEAGKLSMIWPKTLGDRLRCRGSRGVDPDPVVGEVADLEVDGGALDAGAAEVDAEGVFHGDQPIASRSRM